ncbi:nucleoside-binding outer membrane protein [Simiduia agarivorans]|uniref:Nucleoside-binding outer membrane protein n=1 Tax=Simiduia agarivorans (strain DSM 21679 / JCM 13881 / BCRC 17597 / SA1) TaxID=1117647 RepID=K4KM13_SIMAS|nr:nucleoside-binding outer membrane protein [Simiduia agarivorans]AFV00195.1 nucleoside-binding outer membrane protein [Simiduia agarivorans SA1 = DSM 21679]
MKLPALFLNLLYLAVLTSSAHAANWSATELQLTHGNLTTPGFINGGEVRKAQTTLITFQHASGWDYGNNFFFIDYLDDDNDDGFNNGDFYGELYLNFSLGSITGKDLGFGPIKDVGLLAGLNIAGDAKSRKFLPGIRFSWDLPKGSVLNTDVMAYLDHSKGLAGGGAPAQTDSYIIDFNGLYPFQWGSQYFLIAGHIEYIGARENELGGEVAEWILAQPQFRWDLGHALWQVKDQLYLGIEYQYWKNKLGEKGTTESVPQLQLVWRL